MKRNQPEPNPVLHALRTGAIVIALFLLFAFATHRTEVNLEAPLEPRRQEAVMRAIRGLARPDFFVFAEETRSMDISIRMPCPDDIKASQIAIGERRVTLSPNCASTTQDVLLIQGEGFRPFTDGLLRWHPPSEVADSTRALIRFRTDITGRFEVAFTMPDIRPSDAPQRIEVEEKWTTGITDLSDASKTTISAIIETVLLALMATTFGTLLAIPISFLAARNLMEPIGSPLAAIMAGVLGLPIGYWVVSQITQVIWDLTDRYGMRTGFTPTAQQGAVSLAVLIGSIGLLVVLVRAGFGSSAADRVGRSNAVNTLRALLLTLVVLVVLGFAADVGAVAGRWLEARLGLFDFIGGFIGVVFEFLDLAGPAIAGFIGGMLAMSWASRTAQEYLLRVGGTPARVLTIILAGLGSAAIVYGVGAFLDVLYRYDRPELYTTYPALAALALGALLGALVRPKRPFGVGLVLYTLIRAVLNVIRSIEPLVYVIIFAVWVRIGPFAGILALTLHTIASLGKLFSEQVENIAAGPIEAITATGANRIQTVVYAVIPQIVPPYIAFTLYRWDINVRMSTIIGFGGGGGIGFVLAQAINLLRYRQAAVMMIAIAVVVMALDYLSSKVRSRIL